MRILRLDVSDPVVVPDHGRGGVQARDLDQVDDIRVPAWCLWHGERSGGEDAEQRTERRAIGASSTPYL